jgi:hypothetical protein
MVEEDLATPADSAARVETPPAAHQGSSESISGLLLRFDQLVAHRFRQERLERAVRRRLGCGIGKCGHFLRSRLYFAAK